MPNESLEDLVILRADGRPTYNFANPVDDMLDEITHVIRGQDHISNTPKQLQILRALGAEPPVYAHVPDVLGTDGKKLSKRHGAQSVEDFRAQGYIPEALVNFLARLGWAYDDKTEVFSRDELLELFTLERVSSSPAVFDYQKLDVAERRPPARALAGGVRRPRRRPTSASGDRLGRGARAQGGAARPGEDRDARPVPGLTPLPLRGRPARPAPLDGAGRRARAGREALAGVEPFEAEPIERELRALAERLELKPREAFQPIRIAVTGSKVSPGLFESIELLGRDETLRRLATARGEAA